MTAGRLPRGVVPVVPGPGQESVWDYPRPPRAEPVASTVRVVLGGVVVAESSRAIRVLETSHPPGYYLPIEDWRPGALAPTAGSSVCEWKGVATYWDVTGDDRTVPAAAWGYPDPTPGFASIADCVSVYPGRMDRCEVGGVTVVPQPGEFYGGWITPDIVGPFKGGPGTWGW